MPGLSVTKKNHWGDRIEARIDRRIEAIVAHDPGFMERVRRGVRRLALESLGDPCPDRKRSPQPGN